MPVAAPFIEMSGTHLSPTGCRQSDGSDLVRGRIRSTSYRLVGVIGSRLEMQDWGRWASNPRRALPNRVAPIGVTETAHRVSGICQGGSDTTWPELTSVDDDLESLLKNGAIFNMTMTNVMRS